MGHYACVLLRVENEPLQGLSLGWNITLGGAVFLLKVLAPCRKAVCVQTACLPACLSSELRPDCSDRVTSLHKNS